MRYEYDARDWFTYPIDWDAPGPADPGVDLLDGAIVGTAGWLVAVFLVAAALVAVLLLRRLAK